jgi:SecD/SecF fusion protein
VSQVLASAADKLRGTRVQKVEEATPTGGVREAFEIITTETRRLVVAEALLASMGASGADILQVTQRIDASLHTDPNLAPDGLYPIRRDDNTVADVIGPAGENVLQPVAAFKGGVALVFDDLDPPPTLGEVEERLRDMRLQPDFEEVSARTPQAVGLVAADDSGESSDTARFKRVAILVADPLIPVFDSEQTWRTQVAEKELALAEAALGSTRTLQRVTQFDAQIAGEATTKAIIAILLSLLAIAGYLWMRFGSVQFGLAGIIALYHDVAVTLACVMLCHFLWDKSIGRLLGLEDFKIDLSMIAALLTIVGYSINDTIVIFDRIRENRGRLATISGSLINDSLNQTLSRTLITSLTTFMAVMVMYVLGGSGIHGFAFAMIIGSISGVYSTIAIATPMLHHPRAMWVVSIILAALTAMGLVMMIPFAWLKWTLIAIILAAAVLALIKQLAATAGPSRQPATA